MKRLLSLALSLCLLFSNSGSGVLAAEPGTPISGNDYDSIREKFLDASRSGDPQQRIEWQKDATDTDFREVSVCNMPHLLGVANKKNFLRSVIELYGKAREAEQILANEIEMSENNMGKFAAEYIKKLNKKIRGDADLSNSIETLATHLGCTFDYALSSYIAQSTASALSGHFSKVGNISLITGCAFAVGGMVYMAVAYNLGKSAAATICPGVGLILCSSVAFGSGVKYIRKSVQSVDAVFKVQAVQNYAKILKQMYDIMILEPQRMLDSNVFVYAIDRRNFDNKKLLGSKGLWKLCNRNIENHGAWCSFEYIGDLVCSPRARNYSSSDGRSISYLVELFRKASSGNVIDYDRWIQHLHSEGLEFEILPDVICAISVENATTAENIN